MHKSQCDVPLPDCHCPDAAARAIPSKDRHFWEVVELKHYDLHTVNGRLAYHTRSASRGVVYSQCKAKQRYPNWKRATEVMRRRMRNGSMPLRVYHCKFCGGYHLTHTTKTIGQAYNMDVRAA